MSDHAPQQILAHCRRQLPAMVELLRRLALAESPSGDRQAVDQVLRLLAAELEGAGLRVRRPGDLLCARPGWVARGHAVQLVVGHCDTVWPVGTVERMPVRVEGDVLKGPGVFDMKGGLVQLVFALRAVRDLGLQTPATPVVVITSDEEVGSKGSTPLIARLARRAARAFILEPAFGKAGKLKTARKAVGTFEVIVTGEAAHAGINPAEGASAILEMSYQIQRLFALNDAARGVTVNVGTVDGGLRPNVVAPEVRATVDVRVPTRAGADRVEALLRGLRPVNPRTAVRVEGGFDNLPMEPVERNQALWRQARDLGRQLGLELEQAAVGGASDGNTTSLYTATLDGLGAVGDGAHAAHEHVEIPRLAERAALLVLLLAAPVTPDTRSGQGCPVYLPPLAPGGRGAGGEGDPHSGGEIPLTPSPSPSRGEGSKSEIPLTPGPSPSGGEGREPDAPNRLVEEGG